jgi:hypothetical protein
MGDASTKWLFVQQEENYLFNMRRLLQGPVVEIDSKVPYLYSW